MIDNGSMVWCGYGGVLRFGTVQSRRLDDNGWAYYTIKWHADEARERANEYNASINPNREYDLSEFRSSQVHAISPERVERFLREHASHSES